MCRSFLGDKDTNKRGQKQACLHFAERKYLRRSQRYENPIENGKLKMENVNGAFSDRSHPRRRAALSAAPPICLRWLRTARGVPYRSRNRGRRPADRSLRPRRPARRRWLVRTPQAAAPAPRPKFSTFHFQFSIPVPSASTKAAWKRWPAKWRRSVSSTRFSPCRSGTSTGCCIQ